MFAPPLVSVYLLDKYVWHKPIFCFLYRNFYIHNWRSIYTVQKKSEFCGMLWHWYKKVDLWCQRHTLSVQMDQMSFAQLISILKLITGNITLNEISCEIGLIIYIDKNCHWHWKWKDIAKLQISIIVEKNDVIFLLHSVIY